MRMRASSPELRPTWWDGLAAAIVAALAIFTAAWYYGGLARSGPLTAAIVHRGQVVQTVELDRLTEEMTVTVEGDYHLTILLDRDGVRTASTPAPSPGQDRALSACRSRWWCSLPAVVAAAPTRCWDRRGGMKISTRQLALCAVLTALALALLNPMLAWINVTPDNAEVYQAAYTYCFIIFAGIGAQLFYNFICAFLRSMGDSLTPLLFLLFSTVLNVGLDLLFIMVFRWGVAGAAIATVAAQLISTVACFIYAFAKYPQLRLHREDMQITRGDIRRHVVQGVPLGLQFSVLAIGIIVMQSVVVQFDMLDGVMVSSSAQMGFGAANKLFNLTATPMNALGTAMTSFTAQNLGAGNHDRIRKGALQSLVMRIFLSADKITADTVRYGNTFLYVDYAMYLFLGFIFVVRNCIQGIGRSRFVLGAGAAELVARIAVCLTLPAAVAVGVVSAQANPLAFYALCAADPMAWIAADIVLAIPFFRNILRRDYRYMNI